MIKKLALISFFWLGVHSMANASQYFCRMDAVAGWEISINLENGSATFYDGENWFFLSLTRSPGDLFLGPVYFFENTGDSMQLFFDQVFKRASLTIGNQTFVVTGSCI